MMVEVVMDDRAYLPLRGSFTVYREQLKTDLRFLVYLLFADAMIYWGIELEPLTPNEIRQVVAYCKSFGIPTNLEIFRSIFNIEPVKEGPRWHTFQKMNVAKNFILKLSQSIHGWKNGFFYLVDGQQVTQNSWNNRRDLPNYEVKSQQGFIKNYANRLIRYSFWMILKEGCLEEKMLSSVGFYSRQEIDLHKLS